MVLKLVKDVLNVGQNLTDTVKLLEEGIEETVSSIKRNGFILDDLKEVLNHRLKDQESDIHKS
jgi:hypothetical protein